MQRALACRRGALPSLTRRVAGVSVAAAAGVRRSFCSSFAVASSSAPPPATTSGSGKSKGALYQSPLRNADDREYAHLWQNAWVLEAAGAHKHTIVWLHGLGQKTEELRTMMTILQPPNTRIIVPQAPKLSVTCLPQEPDQHAWFDVLEEKMDAAREAAGDQAQEDDVGIEEMTARVHSLLDHELASSPAVPSHQILVAGFAQGGALALHAGLSYPHPLAGIVSLAGYLPLPHLYPEHVSPAQAGTASPSSTSSSSPAAPAAPRTPVLAIHGNSDFVVPIAFAKRRYGLLKDSGLVPFSLKTEWSMGHFLSNASLMGSQSWITHAFEQAQEAHARK